MSVVSEIPARAFEAFVYMSYLGKDIRYLGKNGEIHNMNYEKWGNQVMSLEYSINCWEKVFSAIANVV